MDGAGRSNTAGQKLRVNADVRACVHDRCAGKQGLFQQLPLHAITICFVSCVKGPVDWKPVFVDFISLFPTPRRAETTDISAASELQ
jgi:hypothetical protein